MGVEPVTVFPPPQSEPYERGPTLANRPNPRLPHAPRSHRAGLPHVWSFLLLVVFCVGNAAGGALRETITHAHFNEAWILAVDP